MILYEIDVDIDRIYHIFDHFFNLFKLLKCRISNYFLKVRGNRFDLIYIED